MEIPIILHNMRMSFYYNIYIFYFNLLCISISRRNSTYNLCYKITSFVIILRANC